jgi:hypothetical protein
MDKLLTVLATLLGGRAAPPPWMRRWEAITVTKAVAGILFLVAIAFGIVSAYLALTPRIGPALAALSIAGVLIILACVLWLVGARLARRPRPKVADGQAADPMSQMGFELGEKFGRLVQEKPLTAVSLALVAGFLLTSGSDVAGRSGKAEDRRPND